MDIYKLKFTKLQLEVFRLLCIKSGAELNQREIARFLGVSPTAISKSIKKLKGEGIILYEKQKKINLSKIKLNRENRKVLYFKRVENIRFLYESGVVEFLEDKFPGSTIILFGSYSRGDDLITSDIDIAIIGSKEKITNLKEYEKKLEREIILNFYPSLKKIHKNLKENLCNGVVLVGGIEL